MKVCKVVFNSVSHDARVLKEAQSLRELEYDVVIVGIQDANNRRPIDIMENGVAIRRVAWNGEAVRPYKWTYASASIAAVVGIVLVFLFLINIPGVRDTIYRLAMSGWNDWKGTVGFLCALSGLGLVAKIWSVYFLRYMRFRGIRKREMDELLKFDAELKSYFTKKADQYSESEPAKVKTPSYYETVRPRPMMVGWLEAIRSPFSARWAKIWAREEMVRRVLALEGPDIVHAHDLTALPVCAEYKRSHACKLVFDAHEIYDHLAQSEGELAELNSNIMSKYQHDVDLFVTINDSIANYYRSNYSGFPGPIIVKNAAPLADRFEYDGRLHETAGLPLNRRILIYQGGFAPKRGLLPLLLSSEYLNEQWTLVFMGWGRLESELRRTADALCIRVPKLEERIKFVPKVPQIELPLWTSGASLGAIPYENVGLNHWFCTPNKLWEYPNAGVPIIASPLPELRQIIEPNEIGWFLPDPLSPKVLGEAVNALTPDMLRETREKCLEFIARDNWAVYSDRLKNGYGAVQ